jgi:hypothetical protein
VSYRYKHYGKKRPRFRASSIQIPVIGSVLLVVLLVGVGFYYWTPPMGATGATEASAAANWYAMPDEYAIVVRNDFFGGPYAVPERAEG